MPSLSRLSTGQIINMSFGFFGIQFCFALQTANVSRIFQTLGAEIDKIGFLWIAAPATGLIVQPIIGYLSDHTWHPKWGRRRPFFFIGAVLAAIAMFLMPMSTALWAAAILLWVLDASINISMEPFRAFVGDKLPASQRTMGFGYQTIFIGAGAVIASMLPYIFTNFLGVGNTALEGQISDSVKYSFFVGGIVIFLSVLWTVLKTDEYPPDDLEDWKNNKSASVGMWKAIKEINRGIFHMPRTMKQLALVQFFTWVGFFCMWLYTTSAVAQSVYGTTDATSEAYQNAGNWVGVMFTIYNLVSLGMAFVLPSIADAISRRITHLICLIIGGAGLVSMIYIDDKMMLLLPMIAVGISWASTLTMPYAMLTGSLPATKMGFYMGVFNFFIVIPQLIASFTIGPILQAFFNNHAIYALVIGGISMAVAGLCNFVVDDSDKEVPDIIPMIPVTD